MIIELQRRLAEIGRIRIGQQVPTKNGGTRPEKLTTFRLTSADKLRIDTAAHLFGGVSQQWQAPAGPQWEVVTNADALDVIVPPSDMSFSQHYEMWSSGGCQRRCDGHTEQITQGPCLCDPDTRACSIHTRLSVMLRDLPGLGVWRIDTSGYYAAVELQGAVQVIQVAAGKGHMLPARLRLEQRQVKRLSNGRPETRRFVVPVLDVEVSPGELMAQAATPPLVAESLEHMTPPPLDGTARLTPVPAALPLAPAQSVTEQITQIDQDHPRPTRKGAAAELPATGLQPRTAAQAAAEEPASAGITAPQLKKLQILMRELGLDKDRDTYLAYLDRVIGHPVESSKQLTKEEASIVIEAMNAQATNGDPELFSPPLVGRNDPT